MLTILPQIWLTFVNRARGVSLEDTKFTMTAAEADYLADRNFNGRQVNSQVTSAMGPQVADSFLQIKNTVRLATALANAEDSLLMFKHLNEAIEANADFDDDFRGGSGHSDAMTAYQ